MKIIIIGAGPGGYETALEAAKRGIEVTLITDGPLGGTCLNEGCIPTKTFCHYAELVEEISKAGEHGIAEGAVSFDFSKVAERKEAVVAQLRGGIDSLMRHKLISLVTGHASIRDAHTVMVNDIEISGDYIIIATGSVSSSLPVPGADLPGVLSSKEMLDLTEIPEKLVVIGGGVIGLEFASIFRSFGSEVTVLEYAKDVLPRFDSDLSKRLKQALVKRGIVIEAQAQVTEISSADVGAVPSGALPSSESEGCSSKSVSEQESVLKVRYLKKGAEAEAEGSCVLMAVGRRANLESLNLSEAGIDFTRRGIVVDENMQTSVPGIYAVGDVTGGLMLAHAAVFQGLRALNHICGKADSIDFSVVPAAVFTMPEAAAVGMTEEQCKEMGLNVKCLKSFFRANGKAVSMDSTEGFCKLIVDAEDGEILGCHLFGPHSADIIQELAALLAKKATLSELQDVIHAHPTLGEVIQSAARG